MASQKPTRDYLDKDFDYTKLTRQELRAIMSENGIEDIPPANARKDAIMESYKANIHDRIDYIRSNFSPDNIFQKRSSLDTADPQSSADSSLTMADRSHLTTGSSFISDSKMPLPNTGSFPPVDNISGRFTPNPKVVIEPRSTQEESSEVNSTAYTKKAKVPFIAIPKKKDDQRCNSSTIAKLSCPAAACSVLSCKAIGLLIFLGICCYLKFYSPYCSPGLRFCTPLPAHSSLVNGVLLCDPGYKLQRGLANVCVPDFRDESHLLAKAEDCIRMLEYLKGDFNFGYAKSPHMRVSLISDPGVLRLLSTSSKVVISGDKIEAKTPRTSIRVFLRFYSLFLLKVWLMLLVAAVIIKVWLMRRRKAAMLHAKATAISKEVLDILNRQIMMSVRSTQFKPHVLSQQIKDALDIKDDVWSYVAEIIQRNSNVEKSGDEKGKEMWKWVGPVLYKSDALTVE